MYIFNFFLSISPKTTATLSEKSRNKCSSNRY